MNQEIRRVYFVLIVAVIFFIAVGFYLGWLDNGPVSLF
jgi:hypothetical protein